VVIVSPLTRTLETAAGVFGAGAWQEGEQQPPLMLEQVEGGGRYAKVGLGGTVQRDWAGWGDAVE
jgi:hypothetical protein